MKNRFDAHKVQVHLPWHALVDKLDDIVRARINPEVFLDGNALDSALPEDLKMVRERLHDAGLGVTMHGPYMDLSPGAVDERIRLATVERYDQVFGAIEHLRPKNVVLHACYDDRRFDGDKALWLRQSLKTWPQFVKRAEELGTIIAVENIFEETPDTLRSLVEEINSPNMGVCIDSGHLNLFSTVDMEEWFKELGRYIVEVHMHDNFGKVDDHLPIGEGKIDFRLFLKLLGEHSKDPVLTIEPHGERTMWRAIEAIKKFLAEN